MWGVGGGMGAFCGRTESLVRIDRQGEKISAPPPLLSHTGIIYRLFNVNAVNIEKSNFKNEIIILFN